MSWQCEKRADLSRPEAVRPVEEVRLCMGLVGRIPKHLKISKASRYQKGVLHETYMDMLTCFKHVRYFYRVCCTFKSLQFYMDLHGACCHDGIIHNPNPSWGWEFVVCCWRFEIEHQGQIANVVPVLLYLIVTLSWSPCAFLLLWPLWHCCECRVCTFFCIERDGLLLGWLLEFVVSERRGAAVPAKG